MLDEFDVHALVGGIRASGHGDDIDWAETIAPPADAEAFAIEIIFVICNSGMKHTVARRIFERVLASVRAGQHPYEVFGHRGKANAIWLLWRDREKDFADYNAAEDRLAFIAQLPWIGEITKFHVAKNFGLQVAKPDVHLQRLAQTWGRSPQQICEELAVRSGYKVATIDTLLWRAAAIGLLDTKTGELRRAA